MGSLPSLESRTWPLSSFSVYSILTDEPFSTAELDWAPAGAAARSTHSATRVPRNRIAHPPSSNRREIRAVEPAYTRPRGGANFAKDWSRRRRARPFIETFNLTDARAPSMIRTHGPEQCPLED